MRKARTVVHVMSAVGCTHCVWQVVTGENELVHATCSVFSNLFHLMRTCSRAHLSRSGCSRGRALLLARGLVFASWGAGQAVTAHVPVRVCVCCFCVCAITLFVFSAH